MLTAHDYLLFCLTKFLCARGGRGVPGRPQDAAPAPAHPRVPGRNRLVQRIVASRVGTIACISRAQQTALRADLLPAPPAEVIHNRIDPAPCRDDGGRARSFLREHGLEGRPLVLFGGGSPGPRERPADPGAATPGGGSISTCSSWETAGLLYPRPAPWRPGAGLPQDRLHTPGWLAADALRRALGAADVCATPSVYPDPFDLMNLRAMAHRRPVVGTCYGGTAEIVVDGETGYLADPWDV